MPTHDIIDNRNEKLVDHIKCILSLTERARFAVGYFFLSRLTSIAGRLQAAGGAYVPTVFVGMYATQGRY
jgi:hypothetical protein